MHILFLVLIFIGIIIFTNYKKINLQLFISKKSSRKIMEKDNIPIQTNENPIKAPERFSTKTFFESSKAEKIIYEYLKKSLSNYYIVIPHVSLTDLFSYSKPDGERDSYNIYKFLGYHIDFVIFDKLYHPAMAIELNGSRHKTDPKTIWTDQRKKELFHHFHIPLISLDLSVSYRDHELAPLLMRQIKEEERIVYCWNCHVPIIYPFTECPKCHKSKIPVPALFTEQKNSFS